MRRNDANLVFIRTGMKVDGLSALLVVSDLSVTWDLNQVLGYIHAIEQTKMGMESMISTCVLEYVNEERSASEDLLENKLHMHARTTWPYLIPYGAGRSLLVQRSLDGNIPGFTITERTVGPDGLPDYEVTTHLREALNRYGIRYRTQVSNGRSYAWLRSFELGHSDLINEKFDPSETASKLAKVFVDQQLRADINEAKVGGLNPNPNGVLLSRLTCFDLSEVPEILNDNMLDLIIGEVYGLDPTDFDEATRAVLDNLIVDQVTGHTIVDDQCRCDTPSDRYYLMCHPDFISVAYRIVASARKSAEAIKAQIDSGLPGSDVFKA